MFKLLITFCSSSGDLVQLIIILSRIICIAFLL